MLEALLIGRPYLEVGSFIANIFLAAGLCLTFRQLYLLNRDIRIRSERSAKEQAIIATSRYFDRFVDASDRNFCEYQKLKLNSYNGPIGNFCADSIPPKSYKSAVKKFSLPSVLAPMNELEATAAYFTSGVADERLGFQIIGRTFCKNVEYLYDVISFSRDDDAQAYWHNIVMLYKIWRPRLSRAEMENVKGQLEARLSEMSDSGIAPIGQ